MLLGANEDATKNWRNLLVGPALRMDELGKDETVTVAQGLSGHDNVASLGGEKMDAVSCYCKYL